MKESLSVVIVEADPACRHRACSWLAGFLRVARVEITDNEPEGMLLAREHGADVVLLDVALLPGDRDVPELLHVRYGCPVLLLTGADQQDLVLQALEQGAQGSISKETATAAELVLALETVARGGAVLTPQLAGLVLDRLTSS